jgi:3-deoxy-7-phosphoheptulonate synthase
MANLQVLRTGDAPTTTVKINDSVVFGDRHTPIIAGPCAVESKQQLLETVLGVKSAGAVMFRGGAFKPRTSPYSFQGHGEQALKWMAETRDETGLPFVTEVLDTKDVMMVAEYADMLQIGARNMQNFALLTEVGKSGKPVILKRGLAATLDEWRHAAEYIIAAGNQQIVFCERGIRSIDNETRNVLDLQGAAVMQLSTRFPVIVDNSHAAGRTDLIKPLAKAAIAMGADGLILEVHHEPTQALSDGHQSLTLGQFADLMQSLPSLATANERYI